MGWCKTITSWIELCIFCSNPSMNFLAFYLTNLSDHIYVGFKMLRCTYFWRSSFNALWPSDAIWRQRSGSTLAQVMTCCLTAPSHYLNQCWLIISEVQWHSWIRAISWEMPKQSIIEIHLKITFLKFPSNLPWANELILWNSFQRHFSQRCQLVLSLFCTFYFGFSSKRVNNVELSCFICCQSGLLNKPSSCWWLEVPKIWHRFNTKP